MSQFNSQNMSQQQMPQYNPNMQQQMPQYNPNMQQQMPQYNPNMQQQMPQQQMGQYNPNMQQQMPQQQIPQQQMPQQQMPQQQMPQQQMPQQQMPQQSSTGLDKKSIYLFFSKDYCEHSKRCVERLTKCGIINSITLCNIDNAELNIPSFVTSVPTIYLSDERRILNNKELFEWIESNKNNNNSNNEVVSMNDITGDNNIFAYHQTEMNGSCGNSYAFIDDDQNNLLPSGFEMLDGSNKEKMQMPSFTKINEYIDPNNQTQNVNDEKKNRQDNMSKAYDRMMQERTNDANNTITNMRQ